MLATAQKSFHEGNYTEAIEQYQTLLAEAPDNATLYLELSSCLIALGQTDEALVVARQASNFADDTMRTACELQLANLYLQQERFELAGAAFEKIIHAEAGHVDAHLGLAGLYLKTGLPTKACALLERIPATDNARWVMQMSAALFNTRRAEAAIDCILNYAANHPVSKDMASNAVMYSLYTPRNTTVQMLLQGAYPKQAAVMPKRARPTLKIGFVSADFGWHPVGYFLHSFLSDLRALGVDIVLYSNSATQDSLTQKLRDAASAFTSIHGLSTEAATRLIRQDALDALIDLSGHTAGNRLDVFCQRAAPTQISYLGYPNSTHLTQMDALITDAAHVPEEERSRFCEKVYYLPHSRFCFAAPIALPAIAQAPCETNGYLTFGSVANPAKISDACLDLWGEILNAVPTARLKLRHRDWNDRVLRTPLLERWQKAGIASGRIEFYGDTKYDQYLQSYADIDIVLDTHPFAGGTTTCEALMMGVPVLTLHGTTPAARQGASILQSIGHPQWIATTPKDMVEKICTLSEAPEALREFKASVRERFASAPIGNGALFAKNFHHALTEILNSASA